MPSDTFEIESYSVTQRPRGYNTASLFVTSPAMSHGVRTRATVFFYPESKVPTNIGWAINVGGVNFDGITIYGYADEKYLETMYHVLQTEDPVSFTYGYNAGDTTTRSLYDFSLTTADEPTGEGMAEKAHQALVSAGELDLDEMDAEQLGVEDVDALRPTEEFDDIERMSDQRH